MKLIKRLRRLFSHFKQAIKVVDYPHVHKSAIIHPSIHVLNPENLYMEENTSLQENSRIGNLRSKFILKKNSGAAAGLYVIPGNHINVVGLKMKDITDEMKDELDPLHESDKDVVVEEDVWIGACVSLLNGVNIGRGAIVGTGAVVRTSIPPYSIVIGNPCKIVGFRFTPEEIVEHEKAIYPEEERLTLSSLEKNYEKYYLSKIKEIRTYLKISF